MKPVRWSADEWATHNMTLMARAGGACERCGHECGPVERHHRKRKREGGDSLANLVMLGRPCHAFVHAHPVLARQEGFIVSVSRDPEDVPLHWRRRDWVILTNEGTKVDALVPSGDAHE